MSLPLFERIADTSIETYRDHVVPTLAAREQKVLDGLTRYLATHKQAPTAYELYEWMQAQGEAFDLNSVRPRINGLWHKGRIQQGAKRTCAVTGRTAYTWELSSTARRLK